MPIVESPDGQVRMSVATLAEVITREAVQVPGVLDTMESLLPTIKIVENAQSLVFTEKVEIHNKSLVVDLVVTLDGKSVFWKVALDVQKRVYDTVEKQLGFSLKSVNVVVGKVEWSFLGDEPKMEVVPKK